MPTLNWLTRGEDIRVTSRVPYRLLEEDPDLSAGALDSENMLIQGDNLGALKALLPFYVGQVKCIYIDPPFNTGQAFDSYDDNIEHSLWLGMMYPRIEMLRDMLSDQGSLFVHLDDNQIYYAKILLDEIFHRSNFISCITLKARSPSAFSTVNPGVFKASEYILWYAKDRSKMKQNRVWVPRDPDTAYNSFIENADEPYEQWTIGPIAPQIETALSASRTPSAINRALKKFYVANAHRIVRLAEIDDNGAGADTVQAKYDSLSTGSGQVRVLERVNRENIYLVRGKQLVFYRKNIHEIDGELTPARMLTNIWDDIAWEGIAGEGGVRFPQAKKPERLIRRCLLLATEIGDLVLDSFLGSGTTAAVAHKMGRRYIGIEMGEHAVTHCAPRLTKVIEGEQGGISKNIGWRGGGGFRFYRLGRLCSTRTGRFNRIFASPRWQPIYGSARPTDLGLAKAYRPYLVCTRGTLTRCFTTVFWVTGGPAAAMC